MARLSPLNPDQARPAARGLLAGIIDRHGDAGAMVRTMAHSPALMQGYLELSRAMNRSALSRPLSEKISLALQEWIGCEVCIAAHMAAASAVGITDSEIALARQGVATDAAQTALITYAVEVLTEPSAVSDADIDQLRGHGWSDRILADVVGLVALNQLTGSFNLVAGLKLSTPANA